jgi:predicted CXXCH cytochrome family protein
MPYVLSKTRWHCCLAAMLGLAVFLLFSPEASAGSPVDQANQQCLACHQSKDLSVQVGAKQETLSLYVDPQAYNMSIHLEQAKLRCTDCHSDISGYPHPKKEITSVRAYWQSSYQVCEKCHQNQYTKTQDSMHAAALTQGNPNAPTCTDCHTAHAVSDPTNPRTKILQACEQCHQNVYSQYATSVHGKALIDQKNKDVPVCTDCHGVHNIQDPRTAIFRSDTPDMCARCHADTALMAKYNLSKNTSFTYLQDYHGVTTEYYKTRWPTIWCQTAVCTDCHGIHDIRPTTDPQSLVNPENLTSTCAKCHPGANANFTLAWTGHNQPTPQVAPLTFWVQLFYQIIIPTMVGLLLLYIIVNFVRTMINRSRGGHR